jgi:glycosyltransferase involved in cell wall biosynthesis
LRDFADLRRGRINETIDRITRPIAARYIAVSHSLRKEMIQRGLAPHKILTVHNAPDLDSLNLPVGQTGSKANIRQAYNIPRNAFLLVLVALLRPRKGVEVLITAMEKVVQNFPDTHLLLVGSDDISEDPDYGKRLRRLTAELGLESNVAFVGFRDDVPEILSQCNLMVLPSLFGEGLPMVILEAMAMGVVVVASRVEGTPEVIVDGKDGFLVDPGDPYQLSNKIIQLIKDPVLLQNIGQSARRKIFREMSGHRHAKQIESVYQEVLNR